MIFTDTHTHLYLDAFNTDREEVVRHAIEQGIENMLLPNIDSISVEGMLSLCDSYPSNCFPMMGLHPTSVKDNYKYELDQVESWHSKKQFYAVGEIGIDLYWDTSRQKEQEEAFRRQIQLAKELDLPIVIHSRDSFDEIFRVLEDVYELYEPVASEAGQHIELSSQSATVWVDRDLLFQAVANLVDNAIKYGGQGDSIRVAVSVSDAAVEIVVADSGPGIPGADRDKAFRRFYRLEQSRGQQPGNGLLVRVQAGDEGRGDRDPGKELSHPGLAEATEDLHKAGYPLQDQQPARRVFLDDLHRSPHPVPDRGGVEVPVDPERRHR